MPPADPPLRLDPELRVLVNEVLTSGYLADAEASEAYLSIVQIGEAILT